MQDGQRHRACNALIQNSFATEITRRDRKSPA